MRYLLIIIIISIVQIACSSSAQQITNEVGKIVTETQTEKANRKPFQKSSAVIKSPKDYLNRESKDGKEFDPKPRVVEIDKDAGKYELRWIGYDGQEKVIQYQRADAINAVVKAKIEKNSDDKFVYKYLIKNLPNSPAYVSSFTVQTFAEELKVTEVNDVYIGEMASFIRDFKEGIWWRYAILGETTPRINPGKSIELSLVSSGLPGIVGCRATAGEMTLKGVGEHMPSELENTMPGYEEWAKGYTIGPIDNLATLNKSERTKYILENLPKFLEAGWITDVGLRKYESILKNEDLKGTLTEAQKDLKAGFITSEVFHIIDGLNQ